MSIKLIVLTVLVCVLAYLAVESEGCGFPMPMPMCGGGCGGGCGRRKREITQYPTNDGAIAPAHRVIIPSDKIEECPQSEWKSLLVRNIGKSPSESAKAIKQALYKKYETQFFVVCIPKGERAFVSNGEGYCSVENVDLWCSATAILG